MKPDWSAIGLTGNPFFNVMPGEQLEWVAISDEVREALAQEPFRVELTGPKGAGKSTTLRWYCAQHEQAAYLYVTPAFTASLLEPMLQAKTVCLDEANAARPSELVKAQTLLMATHANVLVSSHWSLANHLGPMKTIALEQASSLEWVMRRVNAHTSGTAFDFEALAGDVATRVNHVNYAVLRVLYEYLENRARSVLHDAALADAYRRVATDPTIDLSRHEARPRS